VKGSAVVAGVLLAIAGGLGLYSRHAWEEQQVAIAATKLEREGNAALEQTKKRPLEGLLSAMRSGEELQQLMQRKQTSEYLTGSPVYALQQALETTKHQTLLAHPGAIRRMIVTPKGDQIITVGQDNSVRTWDMSGNLQNCVKMSDQFLRIEVSPNGNRMVIFPGNKSEKPTVIDSFGRTIKKINIDPYSEITFSPNSDRVLIGEDEVYIQSKDGKFLLSNPSKIRMFDESFNLITQFNPSDGNSFGLHVFRRNHLSFSPKGNIFSISSSDSTIEIRDLSGKLLTKLRGHKGGSIGSNFNPSGDKIVTFSAGGSTRVWDLSGKMISTLKEYAGAGRSLDAGLSPHKDQIITTKGRNIRLWSPKGKLIETFKGHQGEVRFAQFNHDGKHIISLSEDGSIKVWNLNGSVLLNFPIKFRTIQPPILLTQGRVLVEGLNNNAYIWDLSKQISEKIFEKPQFQFKVGGPFINSSLSRILVLLENSQANILDAEGNMIAKINLRDIPEAKSFGVSYFTEWHFSRNRQNIIATAYIPGKEGDSIREENPWDQPKPIKLSLFIFDLQGKFIKAIKNSDLTNRESTAYADESDSFNDSLPQINSSGEYILTSTDDGSADDPGTVSLSMKSGQKLFDIDGKRPHMHPRYNLFLTHNDNNSTVKVWDFSGQLVAEFKHNQPYLADAKFSSNGDRVIMLFENGNIQTHPIETLPQMLKRGCTWLRTYLAANPTELKQLPTCQAQQSKTPQKQ
jgi:WD40 repeat protein